MMRRLLPRCLVLLALSGAAPGALAAPLISPSGDTVPENLLRIELQLDAPLAGQLDMRHVMLVDGTGTPIRDALLDIPLASRDRTRVSILLHPGRIKTGVGPNVALGMALHQGTTLVLRIDDPQLPQPLRKSWTVVAPASENIDVNRWVIQAPAAATRKPLLVAFPAALDAGAVGMIAVAAPDGGRLDGRAKLVHGEMQWQFIPTHPWRAGDYQVRAHPEIEDPQGNRMCSAFEQVQQSGKACRGDGVLDFSVR